MTAAVRLRFVAWSALMLAVLAAFALRVLPQPRVETDILALLPQERQDPDLDAALTAFSSELARKQITLVSAATPEQGRRAAA